MDTQLLSPDVVPLEHLEAVICEGAANLTAAERDWLLAVAEFDRRRGWVSWGVVSCAAWLSWKVGLDVRTAHEKVRVAHALEAFPLVSAAMATGEMSYAKARAITRIVAPETEEALVTMALAGTTNHVERIVSAYRRSEQAELSDEQAQYAARGVHSSIGANGLGTITIELPAEAHLAVLAALEQFLASAQPDIDGRRVSLSARRADAVVRMAEAAVDAVDVDRDEPRYLVTVHVDAPLITGDSDVGRCDIGEDSNLVEQPLAVPNATARRMACDADLETIVESGDGDPLRMGRRSRVVRGRLKRAVKVRDGGCRFPGCNQRGRVDAHHIIHWLDDGPTDIDNLVCLCRFHHRWLHEGEWWIEIVNGEIALCAPDGRRITARPPAVVGDRRAVDVKGRSAADGRCKWLGEQLDLDCALAALFSRSGTAAAAATS